MEDTDVCYFLGSARTRTNGDTAVDREVEGLGGGEGLAYAIDIEGEGLPCFSDSDMAPATGGNGSSGANGLSARDT